jgi:hypothetical protein
MMQQMETREQGVVAEAYLPGVTVTFHQDGTATLTEAYTLECARCGALHDHEGEAVTLDPAEAWGLLQALRRFLSAGAYREASQVIRAAIEGPQEGEGAEIVWDEEGHEWVIG